ncbi:MAG: universal stress protein [Mucilaginibacter sp.]|nr:universal stress protein [Mucilaginibacter sp.]
MKTILVLTDFSQPAYNAAIYALQLAKQLKAEIKLCHAFKVPAEAPVAAQVAWPLENYSSLKPEADEKLHFLAETLSKELVSGKESLAFKPLITYTSEVGPLTEVARNLVNEQKLSLVVMGTSGTGGLIHFIMGSNCREMIDKACFPLLLVPSNINFKYITKIGFATDLSGRDMDVIHSLAGVARMFNAEILISHVTDEKFDDQKHQHQIDNFLNEVTCTINYHKIYYQHIKQRSVDSGLEWLTEHGQLDMLAMIHRQNNAFSRMFLKSHTQKMARQIELPLLVFPDDYHSII